MLGETDDLLSMKKRLEQAVFANDLAMLIITDNMNCRETREGLDKCQDDVELNLIKARHGNQFFFTRTFVNPVRILNAPQY
jgi:Tektin family